MYQDAIWYVGRLRIRPHCARCGPSSPCPKRGHTPNFRPITIVETTAWVNMPLGMEVGLGPGHIVLDRNPAAPPPKGGTAPNFWLMFVETETETKICKPNSHNIETRISSKLNCRVQPYFAQQYRPPGIHRGWSKCTHNKSKVAGDRHFEKSKNRHISTTV